MTSATPRRRTGRAKLRVHNLFVSLDGYGAGPDQSLAAPLGVGGERLTGWVMAARSWRASHGMDGGETGVDDDFLAAGETGIGATIMGRNMFGPVRGPWSGSDWTGWWGDEPPFRHRVFVLSHHAREPLQVGQTSFTFVPEGIEAAWEQAADAAGGLDVRLGGGMATVRQYLRAGLVDDLHVAIVPVVLGGGEPLWDSGATGYECVELTASRAVVHARFTRTT